MADKAFNRDYIIYSGSDFEEKITFSQIYIDNDVSGTYTLTAGMKLASDVSRGFALTAEVVPDNSNDVFALSASRTVTATMSIGDYMYAVDLSDGTKTKTILEGKITVMEDISNV